MIHYYYCQIRDIIIIAAYADIASYIIITPCHMRYYDCHIAAAADTHTTHTLLMIIFHYFH